MRECLRCGGSVSDTYARVNSANDGKLYSCPACTPDGETLTSLDQRSSSERFERRLEQLQEDEHG